VNRAIIASMDGADMHAHAHPHHHHDAGHSHDISADADRRHLTIAFLLITGFMTFEVVAGIVAHSLALLSDAAHMLTDAGALALSLIVIRFVQRPGGEALTYGRRRAEVLSGQANSAVLLVLGVLVSYESIMRLITPPDVAGMTVTVVAALGVAVNIAAAWVLATRSAVTSPAQRAIVSYAPAIIGGRRLGECPSEPITCTMRRRNQLRSARSSLLLAGRVIL